MRRQQSIARALKKYKLEHHRKAIEAALIPAVRITYRWRPYPPALVGASKLGGEPDLHWSELWPSSGGRPLHFLGQLRLSEISKHLPRGWLPQRGRMTLWYDSLGEKKREDRTLIDLKFEPSLLHLRFDPDENVALQRREWPVYSEMFRLSTMEDWAAYPETPVHFEPIHTIQQATFRRIMAAEERQDPKSGWNRCYEFLRDVERVGNRFDGEHRILGDIYEQQSENRFAAACMAAGVSEFARHTPRQEQRLRAEASRYRLLVMLDSDSRSPGFVWGDGGSLQWWIRDTDLKAGRLGAAVGVYEQGS